jgi:DNA-binding NtrC family response regulator
MNSAVVLKGKAETAPKKVSAIIDQGSRRPTILIATVAPEICNDLKELLQTFSFNTIWAKGVEAAKSTLARERVVACLCGFWLQDGTYRELVRYIWREKMELPVILVSEPDCPREYRDYLAAINIGTLDFLCHPYRKSDLEGMLGLALGQQGLATVEATRSVRRPSPLVGPDLHPRAA